MIIVPVKEGESIDKVLKKLKRKFEKTGVVKELRERQKFTKPSIKNRDQRLKAIYIQKLQQSLPGA
ncbi:MAG TPA: 30S ribosomal protein S21 [Bacteroidales bacterium]|nr:30S ribosomal protein S21 [Bacteroidales bacterium]HPS17242.1 30S ribosomal protein S21 [Bacteroidales bacterium]